MRGENVFRQKLQEIAGLEKSMFHPELDRLKMFGMRGLADQATTKSLELASDGCNNSESHSGSSLRFEFWLSALKPLSPHEEPPRAYSALPKLMGCFGVCPAEGGHRN